MNSYRNNPESEENQLATKQNDAEIFALQMQHRKEEEMKEDLDAEINEDLDRDRVEYLIKENQSLRLENDILRKMNESTRQYNEQLLADRQEMQSCAGLPELKPITTELLPSPSPIAPYPKGRWQHL